MNLNLFYQLKVLKKEITTKRVLQRNTSNKEKGQEQEL
jgi:hypothetical protein